MPYWTRSSIYFDPTVTLLLRRSIPSFLFIAGISLREVKERTKMFYNNVNSKKLKSLEELVTAIAAIHNIIRAGGGEVILT
jgi:hypothetical protein